MNELTTPVGTTQSLRIPRYVWVVIVGVILLFTGLLLYQVWTSYSNQDDAIDAIEERYGIRITMLAVTAGGGAVDFRFQVVDPDKASVYLHGTEDLPVLIVEGSGARIEAPNHAHTTAYQYGIVYYMLYGNPRSVIRPGTKVTAVLGDLRLRHIVVR